MVLLAVVIFVGDGGDYFRDVSDFIGDGGCFFVVVVAGGDGGECSREQGSAVLLSRLCAVDLPPLIMSLHVMWTKFNVLTPILHCTVKC